MDWISLCFSHRTAEDADSCLRVLSQTFYMYEQIHLACREAKQSMNFKIQVDRFNITQQLILSSQKQWFIA